MAVTFVGVGAAATGDGSNPNFPLKPAIPAGVSVGDILLIVLDAGGNSHWTAPSGWALQHSTDAGGRDFDVWWKFATSSDTPGSKVTFTLASGSTGTTYGFVLAYRGATTAPAFAASATGTPPSLASAAQAVLSVATSSVSSSASESGSNFRQSVGSSSAAYLAVADWLPSGSHTAGPVITGVTQQYGAAYVSVGLTGNRAPNAPTLTSPANNATLDRGITQRFAWTFSDPDAGDSQSKFDLQYRVVNTTPWTTVTSTTPNAFYDFAAGTFAAGNYEWQVRTYDSQGLVGPWSASSFFTAASAPPAPTITAPINGATVPNTSTLTWSAPNQTDYEVRRVADNAGSADTSTIYSDTGDVVDATTRSITVAFDTNNRWEHLQVRIKNAGLWSTWADARVQVSYTLPTVATFTMTPDPTTATRTLTITNPAPGGGVPATAYNDVYCRTAASSTVLDTYRPYSATGTRIGTALATNTTWVDRTPAGDPVVYEYRVVSVATNQTTSDSGWQATG